jgi:acylphosphatase
VQGVGYRYFAQHTANAIGVCGYVRNLDSGDVEVYAVGTKEQLSDLAAMLWKGPRYADVRGVEEQEAPVERCAEFHTRH